MNIALDVRDALEAEGLGPSEWGRSDCVSLIRAAILAQGVEPLFELPDEIDGTANEAEAVAMAKREFGSLEAGWLAAVEREPALVPWDGDPFPGAIGLTAESFEIDGIPADFGPTMCVYGPDLVPLTRTKQGLGVAHPVARLWRVAR